MSGRCVQPSEAGGERELRVLSKKMYDLISRMTMSVAVHEVVISGEMLEFTLFCKKKSGRDDNDNDTFSSNDCFRGVGGPFVATSNSKSTLVGHQNDI